MKALDERVREIALQGRCCTQIMVQLALDERSQENPQMVKAVSVLCEGLHAGFDCGALSGGALAMALLAKRTPRGVMVSELADWFEHEYGTTRCDAILGGDPSAKLTRCPGIVERTYAEAKAILEAHGFAAT